VLLVELNNGQLYIVDVGLGEPPLWPLRYVVDQVQTTPEGMASRIVWGTPWMDGQGRQRRCLIQEWWMQDTEEWTPRLQWDIADAPIHESLSVPVGLAKKHTLNSFQHVVDILLHPKSTFSRKAIVCILTRTEKISLSGRTLKITCPRFGPTRRSQAIELASDKQVLIVLKQYFGIELCQAKELDLSSSLDSANIRLWEHL
jgi:arylamine N-acetyltransferase